jgi:membrane protease YdiL (CAAX protease family)
VPDKVPFVSDLQGAAPVSPASPVSPVATEPRLPLPRWLAAIQVFAVCGIPTQTVVLLGLVAAGRAMGEDGAPLTMDPANISLEFFAMSTLLDTAVMALLIRLFLTLSGENSSDVFLGKRPVAGEILRGIALVPVMLCVAVGLILLARYLVPVLHNVPKNPLEAYMDSPLRAGIFIVVVMLGGGVREELQRAFILHRFEQRLGGIWLGLAVWSVAFGLFHIPQGYDAAITVGLLGFAWGWLYIRLRSVVAAMVSHAGFNALQVLGQVFLKL